MLWVQQENGNMYDHYKKIIIQRVASLQICSPFYLQSLLSNKEGIYKHCNIDCREGTVPKVRPNSEEAAPLSYVKGTETLV